MAEVEIRTFVTPEQYETLKVMGRVYPGFVILGDLLARGLEEC